MLLVDVAFYDTDHAWVFSAKQVNRLLQPENRITRFSYKTLKLKS